MISRVDAVRERLTDVVNELRSRWVAGFDTLPEGRHPGRLILVTGAAGMVGTLLRPFLREHFRLRLTDRRPVEPLRPNEEFVAADLLDAPAVALAARGVDAIIHLGAIGRSAPWNVLEAVNVQGTRSVLDAARINGVRRVILASTMHVLGGYGRDERIGPTSALRPDSPYAESKVLMEELAQTFSDHHHLEIGCIRIGHVHPNRRQAEPGLWIAPADLATVIRAGLDHADLRFAILHGVAPYRGDDCGQRLMRGQYGIVWRYGGGPYSVALRRARVYFRQAPCGIEYRGGFFVAAAGPGGSPGSGGEVNHLVRADYTGGGVQTANLNR